MVIKRGTRYTGTDRIYTILVYCFLTAVGLICILPVLYVVSVSFTPYSEYIRAGGVFLLPRSFTVEAYRQFFSESYVFDVFRTTIIVSTIGTFLNVLVTVLMAYPLSNRNLVFYKFFNFYTLIPLMITGGMIPTYMMVKQTGIMNTIWAYVMPGLVWSYNLVITRSFFSKVDKNLKEAAIIDGAGEWTILFKIVLPVSAPIIATIALMYAVSHWNDYYTGYLYISSPKLKSIQVFLKELLDRNKEDMSEMAVAPKSLQMAGIVISAIPIITVYPFLQKHFTQGIMLGSIKG